MTIANFFGELKTSHIDPKEEAILNYYKTKFDSLEKVYNEERGHGFKKQRIVAEVSATSDSAKNDQIAFQLDVKKKTNKDALRLKNQFIHMRAKLSADLKRDLDAYRKTGVFEGIALPTQEGFLYEIPRKDLKKILESPTPYEAFVLYNEKENVVSNEFEVESLFKSKYKIGRLLQVVKKKSSDLKSHYYDILNMKDKDIDSLNDDMKKTKDNWKNLDIKNNSGKGYRKHTYVPIDGLDEVSIKHNMARFGQHKQIVKQQQIELRETNKKRSLEKREYSRKLDYDMNLFADEVYVVSKRVSTPLDKISAKVDFRNMQIDLKFFTRPIPNVIGAFSLSEENDRVQKILDQPAIERLRQIKKDKKHFEHVKKVKEKKMDPDEIVKRNAKFNHVQSIDPKKKVPVTFSDGTTKMVDAKKAGNLMERIAKRAEKRAAKMISGLEIKSESSSDKELPFMDLSENEIALEMEDEFPENFESDSNAFYYDPGSDSSWGRYHNIIMAEDDDSSFEVKEVVLQSPVHFGYREYESISRPLSRWHTDPLEPAERRRFNMEMAQEAESNWDSDRMSGTTDHESGNISWDIKSEGSGFGAWNNLEGMCSDLMFQTCSGFNPLAFIKDDLLHPYKMIEDKFGKQMSDVVHTTVGVLCMSYQIVRSRNKLDTTVAIVHYLNGHGIVNVSQGLYDLICLLCNMATNGLALCSGSEVVSESLSDYIDLFKDNSVMIFTSEFASKMRELALVAIASKWFPKDIMKHVKYVVGAPTKMNLFEMLGSVLEATSSLVRMGEALIRGVPINEVLFSKDPVNVFLDKSEKILFYKDRLYTGLPSEGRMCQKLFRSTVGKLIETGNVLVKTLTRIDPRRRKVENTLLELSNAACDVDEYCRTHERTPPFGFILYGFPNIGKSMLIRLILEIWSRVKGRKFTEDQMFTRTKSSPYWEGLIPSSHPYCHYSEMGNQAERLAKMEVSELLIELQSLLDGAPFVCDMAFKEKGKVYASFEFIIIDTNNPTMHCEHQMFSPGAMMRRFFTLKADVKPAFREENGTALDKRKSLEAPGNLLDRYYFTGSTHKAVGNKAEEVFAFQNVGLEDMVVHLANIFTRHIAVNEEVKSRIDYTFIDQVLPHLPVPPCEFDLNEHDEKAVEIANKVEKSMSSFNIARKERVDKAVSECDLKMIEDYFTSEPLSPLSERTESDMEPMEFKYSADGRHELLPDTLDSSYTLLSESNNDRNVNLRDQLMANKQVKLMPIRTTFSRLNNVSNLLWLCLQWLCVSLICVHKTNASFRVFCSSVLVFVVYLLAQVMPFWCFILGYLVYFATPDMEAKSFVARFLKNRLLDFAYDRVTYIRGELKNLIVMRWNFIRNKRIFVNARNKNPYDWQVVAASTAAAAGAVLFLRKFFKKKNKVESESLVSKFVFESPFNVPLNEIEEKYSITRDEVRVRTKDPDHPAFNVVDLTTRQSTYNGSPESLFKVIGKNCRRVKVITSKDSQNFFILGVRGTLALIEKHGFAGCDEGEVWIYENMDIKEGDLPTKINVKLSECVEVATDVYLFDTIVKQFRDIVHHFVRGSVKTCQAFINGEKTRAYGCKTKVTIKNQFGNYEADDYFYYVCNHYAGLCGQPLVGLVDKEGSGILGVHNAGASKDKYGYAIRIDRDKLIECLNLFKSPYLEVCSQGVHEDTYMPHAKSPSRFLKLNFVEYEGRNNDVVLIHKKSRLTHAPYFKESFEMLEREFKFEWDTIFDKPMMEPTRVNGEYISPYNIGLEKMDRATPPPDNKIAKIVIEKLSEHIILGLERKGLKMLSPLKILDAINGVDDDPFISRINASTSGAYRFPGPKGKHMPLTGEDDNREPDANLKKHLSEIYSKYGRKECCCPIYTVQLKDEPRDIEKCKLGKTRLFYMSPLDHLIVSRQLLAPFYSLMVEFSDVFGTAVGINMHTGADKMARNLRSFSDEYIEGDYSGFDLCNPGFVARIVNTVVFNVLQHFGYSKVSLDACISLFSDNLFTHILMNGDIYSKCGLQPSGKYATAEDNSLRGLVMLMYAWYFDDRLRDRDFFEYCLPYLYGDDVLVAVKSSVSDIFNNLTYADSCKKHYNIEFTNSQKTGDFKKTLSFEETTFLKRKFVWNEKFNRYLAPLDMNSIGKAMQWNIPSDSVTSEEQCKSTLTSVLWELFFHVEDENQFFRIKNDFERWMLDNFGIPASFCKFPSYRKILSTLNFEGHEMISDDMDEDFETSQHYTIEIMSQGSIWRPYKGHF